MVIPGSEVPLSSNVESLVIPSLELLPLSLLMPVMVGAASATFSTLIVNAFSNHNPP